MTKRDSGSDRRPMDLLPPFSEEEFFRAYRIFFDDHDARQMAWSTFREIEEVRHILALPPTEEELRDDAKHLPGKPLYGVVLSDDVLATLSLLSPDLEQRVMEYRAKWPADPERDAAWRKRRKDLTPTVRERLREER